MPISKPRAEVLAKGYVKNAFNMSKTLRQLEPNLADPKKQKVLSVKASRALGSDSVRKAIRDVLEEQGFTNEFSTAILRRNARQVKNYSASNEAVKLAEGFKGNNPIDKQVGISFKIDLSDPKAIDERLKLLQEELKLLNG